MIRIVMLDLGDTLAHENTVFPHVPAALEALRNFKTVAGDPVELSLVSDFFMPEPPPTPQKIEVIFKQYLAILDELKLTKFFKPVARRVTLSTHAGVRKPKRQIFELAIKRLGLQAQLGECLFITENAEHIAACRQLGMKTLHFGPTGSPGIDFSDWSEGPLLISHLLTPASNVNLEPSLKLSLAANYGVEVVSMKNKSDGSIHGEAHKWYPVPDPKSGGKKKIHVPIPVEVNVKLDDKGRVRSVSGDQPDPESVKEAASFVEALEDNKQVTHKSGPLEPGTTHQVETDAQGQKRLVRKRFSAI
jgi:hypothetical protein